VVERGREARAGVRRGRQEKKGQIDRHGEMEMGQAGRKKEE
jgi:hypothetical protein